MPAITDNIGSSEPLTSKEIRETYRTESSGTRESVFVLLFAHKHRFLRRSPPVGWPGATENAKADLEGVYPLKPGRPSGQGRRQRRRQGSVGQQHGVDDVVRVGLAGPGTGRYPQPVVELVMPATRLRVDEVVIDRAEPTVRLRRAH